MKAIFPGSFDPVTLGHLDLINRASAFCDELIVALLINPDKQGFFTIAERFEMLTESCQHLPNVRVMQFSGLLVDLAKQEGVRLVVRGVRSTSDLEMESAMAQANAVLLPGLETLLLPASSFAAGISSSLVRQIASFHGDVTPFVPPGVVEQIQKRQRR